MRWVAPIALLVLAGLAHAEPAIGSFEAIGAYTCHARTDCQSGLAELGVGYRLRLDARTAVGGRLLVTRPDGVRDGRDASSIGGGGEVLFRWHPLAGEPLLDPFAELVAGVFVHRDDWPPGGSRYILRRGVALGLTVHAGPVDVSVGAGQQHLSNGQGLGAHNPAFDGWGGFVTVTALPHAVALDLAPSPVNSPTDAVLQAQLSLTEGAGELGPAGRVEARVAPFAAPFAALPGGWVAVRADIGRLLGVDYLGAELTVAGQGRVGAVAITGGAQSFGGLWRRRVAGQAEWYADPLATVAASLAYANHTLGGDDIELRVVWLLYPIDAIALGLGAEYTWDDAPQTLDDIQPAGSVEVALPWLDGFTLVAEAETSGLRVLSLRYTAGAPVEIRARDRGAGVQPLR